MINKIFQIQIKKFNQKNSQILFVTRYKKKNRQKTKITKNILKFLLRARMSYYRYGGGSGYLKIIFSFE